MSPKDILKNYLEEKNLNPRQFSSLCGISYTSIYFYLRGQNIGPRGCRKIFLGTRGEIDLGVPYKTTEPKKSTRKILKKRTQIENMLPEISQILCVQT